MLEFGFETAANAESSLLFVMAVTFSVLSAFISACLFDNHTGRPRIISVDECEAVETGITPP